jgi:dihydrofolate synthase/folylpolyglutamate synthase
MAFVYFARAGIDIAVIEVGLGGRLDATNVIDPLVSVITTIGLDHTEFLGVTIEAIAAEKAGIIKPGKPVVIGRLAHEAEEVVRRVARERQAPVFALGTDFDVAGGQGDATFTALGWSFSGIRLGLGGAFQIENMATALAALTQIRPAFAIDERAVREGLASVRWPGRLEQVSSDPLVLLDGAHNLEGTRALARELDVIARGRRVHVLFAVMRDKPWPAMIDLLAPLCASAVVTEVLPPRGAAAADVAAAWARHCPTVVVPDPAAAWAAVTSCAKRGELVLVTGSLFLIGAVYPLCRGGWDVGDGRGGRSGAH